MRKRNKCFIFFVAISLILACKPENVAESEKRYEIISSDGIYVEKFDSTELFENRYTANNKTYLEGNQQVFDFCYVDLKGDSFKFEEVEGAGNLEIEQRARAWNFVPIDGTTGRTVDKVVLTVEYGLEPMINTDPDYNQTVISYRYPQVDGGHTFSSRTGLIENEKNIWMHPPRDRFFRILELNPFPFIQAPYVVGNSWTWSLKIGSFWGDQRWREWQGSIENKYKYEIVDKINIATGVGELECYEVHSTAKSSIGQTHLKAFFNPEIGFVRLEYTNIDSTRTIFELIEFRNTK